MQTRIIFTTQRARKSPSSVRQPTPIQQWTARPDCRSVSCSAAVHLTSALSRCARCNAMHCLPRQLRCAGPSFLYVTIFSSVEAVNSHGVENGAEDGASGRSKTSIHCHPPPPDLAALTIDNADRALSALVITEQYRLQISRREYNCSLVKYPYLPHWIARVISIFSTPGRCSHINISHFRGSCDGLDARGHGPKLQEIG